MTVFITIVHISTCLLLIAVVLLQHGRGADMGAAFGGGSSNTVFGARGAGSFLTRLTTGAAIVFMLTSLSLSYFANPPTIGELLEEEAVIEAVAPPEGEVEESVFTEIPLPEETTPPEATPETPGGG